MDKKANNGTPTTESARGTASYTDNQEGDIVVRVFLPENVGEADRTITLNLYYGDGTKPVASKVITQKCPAWNGTTGWEVIDDQQQGQWGFDSQKQSVYVFDYGGLNLQDIANTLNALAGGLKTALEGVQSQYDPNKTYSTIGQYSHRILLWDIVVYYMVIDYSSFNNLGTNASSRNEGLTNTKQLFSLAGPVYSNALEQAVLGLRQRYGEKQLMVERTGHFWLIPDDVPVSSQDDGSFKNTILNEVLKKNRFYLNTQTTGSGDNTITTTAPMLRVEDLVWYLPAVDQFKDIPTWTTANGQPGSLPADLWSSTVAPDAGGVRNAYLGNNTPSSRKTAHHIRAARTK